MKILIPMAGNGQRFVDAGYKDPKPLIDVLGAPMIERVIMNLGGPSIGEFIFVVRDLRAASFVRKIVPDCRVVFTNELTAGAACTALRARHLIDDEESLLIANSDQLVYGGHAKNYPGPTFAPEGAIWTFPSENPKWSYAAVDEHGWVWGVAEKQPISKRATCGIYWFKHGGDFCRYAQQMIDKNLRVNNEFYIAPVYNQMIAAGHDVVEYPVVHMWGLGTPEDLRAYEDAQRTRS